MINAILCFNSFLSRDNFFKFPNTNKAPINGKTGKPKPQYKASQDVKGKESARRITFFIIGNLNLITA